MGNRIIQTGNGIISPISWPLIKKLLLQKVANFYNGVQNWCWKEETTDQTIFGQTKFFSQKIGWKQILERKNLVK